jgi:hypothetical protein
MTVLDEILQRHRELRGQLKAEVARFIERPGCESAYLNATAQRLFGVDQFWQCSIAQLEEMLAQLKKRTEGRR